MRREETVGMEGGVRRVCVRMELEREEGKCVLDGSGLRNGGRDTGERKNGEEERSRNGRVNGKGELVEMAGGRGRRKK